MQLLQLVQRFFLTTVPTHQDNTVLHCIGAVEPYYRPQGLLDPQPGSQVGDWLHEAGYQPVLHFKWIVLVFQVVC